MNCDVSKLPCDRHCTWSLIWNVSLDPDRVVMNLQYKSQKQSTDGYETQYAQMIVWKHDKH